MSNSALLKLDQESIKMLGNLIDDKLEKTEWMYSDRWLDLMEKVDPERADIKRMELNNDR